MMTEPATILAPMTVTWTWEGERAPFAKAFIAAQMATDAVKKAASNPHFKSKYADLSEVVEATVPALNKSGIGVIQVPGFDGHKVSITTIFLHEGGSSLTGVLHLSPSKSDPQGVGSAITYGRRYALLAMTGAAPEDDDGNAASGPRQQARPQQQRQTQQAATPSLKERADALEAALLQASPDDLPKAWAKGSELLALLSTEDPDRLDAITALYEQRLDIPF